MEQGEGFFSSDEIRFEGAFLFELELSGIEQSEGAGAEALPIALVCCERAFDEVDGGGVSASYLVLGFGFCAVGALLLLDGRIVPEGGEIFSKYLCKFCNGFEFECFRFSEDAFDVFGEEDLCGTVERGECADFEVGLEGVP